MVRGASSWKPWLDRVHELRVEDHPEPHILVLAGRLEEALSLLHKAFRLQRSWGETTRRLPAIGLVPDDPALLAMIVAEA